MFEFGIDRSLERGLWLSPCFHSVDSSGVQVQECCAITSSIQSRKLETLVKTEGAGVRPQGMYPQDVMPTTVTSLESLSV